MASDKRKANVGDVIYGRLLWGDGSIVKCKILELDAEISRDAFVVETPSGESAIMLVQSVVNSFDDQSDA